MAKILNVLKVFDVESPDLGINPTDSFSVQSLILSIIFRQLCRIEILCKLLMMLIRLCNDMLMIW